MRGITNVIKKSDNGGNASTQKFVINAYSDTVGSGVQYITVDCHNYSKMNLEIFQSSLNSNIDQCQIRYIGKTYENMPDDFYINNNSYNIITINSNGTLSNYGKVLTNLSISNYDIIKIGIYNNTIHRISLICTME